MVQRTLRGQGEPLPDPFDEPGSRPRLLQIAELLVVQAERAGQLLEPQVEVGYRGEILAQRQDFGRSLVVSGEDGDQPLPVLDGMFANLTEFYIDLEYDRFGARCRAAFDQAGVIVRAVRQRADQGSRAGQRQCPWLNPLAFRFDES